MPASRAEVATEHASRYVTRLCKHFAHKVPAEYKDGRGRVDFPFGQCQMEAAAGRLNLRCQAEDRASLERACEVVGSHLERMAAALESQPPISVSWQSE